MVHHRNFSYLLPSQKFWHDTPTPTTTHFPALLRLADYVLKISNNTNGKLLQQYFTCQVRLMVQTAISMHWR